MIEKEDERKEEGCLCSSGDPLFLACAGGSNVGQISNQAAVELAKEGRGKLFCLAGIGAHLDTMIVAARERNLVAIDGCPVQCAKKILDHASLPVALAVVVTDLGRRSRLSSRSIPPTARRWWRRSTRVFGVSFSAEWSL